MGKGQGHTRLRICLSNLGLTARIAGAVVLIVQLLSSAIWTWPAGPTARIVVGCGGLSIASFHLINTYTREELKHWDHEDLVGPLRGELLLGCGVPMTAVAIVALAPSSAVAFAAIAVLFLLGALPYELIQETIYAIVEGDDGLAHGTTAYGKCKPLKRVGINRSIEDMTQGGPTLPLLRRPLGFWIKPSWRPGLSRTRIVIVYAMLVFALIAAGAAGDVGIREYVIHHPAPIVKSTEKGGDGSDDGKGGPNSGATTEGGGTTGGAKGSKMSKAPCPHLPAFGAPAWAHKDLNALYYGGRHLNATPPPGEIGGCTGRAVVPAAEKGAFVYTIGRNALGETLSVAVDSREFGPAIFLSPSAKRVLELIHTGQAPLGGYPTKNVVGGDYAAVTTEAGTFLFVRGAKHLPDQPTVAMPYQSLSPPLARAWLAAMAELDSWLWPLPPIVDGDIEHFRFVTERGTTDAMATITFRPVDDTALWNGVPYRPSTKQLSQWELERLAELAR